MKRLLLALSIVTLSASAGLSADDPIAVRKALMQSAGAAAGAAGGMMKGDIAYNPVVAKAAIATLNGVSHAFGDFFPEGSDMGADTTAAPKIWEDSAAFAAEVGEFQEKTTAAMQASGKDGPADLDAFKAAMGPVFGNCKSCHEAFRVKN